MDLRPHKPTSAQIERATELACLGLLCYQPFIFSEGLQTGAGFEFEHSAEFSGLVYCADPPQRLRGRKEVERFLIDPSRRGLFAESNQRLRVLYETFIGEIERRVGPIDRHTFADVGCCSGYFPLSFARRGSPLAVGFDRVDYSPTFELLNEILGTRARFVHRPYRAEKFIPPGRLHWLRALRHELASWFAPRSLASVREQFDVVVSIAVLVHLSDPLQHLAYLGELARKAILVWTLTSDKEDELAIEYLSVNRYYPEDRFPYCFDVMRISPGLLRKSLEQMGFTEIHEIRNRPEGMPDDWFSKHRGYLAIRP
jgi:SAM-dependent methyltransferase